MAMQSNSDVNFTSEQQRVDGAETPAAGADDTTDLQNTRPGGVEVLIRRVKLERDATVLTAGVPFLCC